jgi:hypothetical protein
VPFVPNGRRLDGLHNLLESGAILLDQTRVQANLRAVAEPAIICVEIERLERITISAAVLIIALIGHDEREVRDIADDEVGVRPAPTIKGDDVVFVEHKRKSAWELRPTI